MSLYKVQYFDRQFHQSLFAFSFHNLKSYLDTIPIEEEH